MTFTKMAEEWIRVNMPTVKTPITPERDEPDPLDRLRQAFIRWFDSETTLDVEAVARCAPPQWLSAVDALHADCTRWALQRQQTPLTAAQFRNLLLELCCELRRIGDEEYVTHVALKEVVQAHQKFQQPPPPPAKPRGAARRRK